MKATLLLKVLLVTALSVDSAWAGPVGSILMTDTSQGAAAIATNSPLQPPEYLVAPYCQAYSGYDQCGNVYLDAPSFAGATEQIPVVNALLGFSGLGLLFAGCSPRFRYSWLGLWSRRLSG